MSCISVKSRRMLGPPGGSATFGLASADAELNHICLTVQARTLADTGSPDQSSSSTTLDLSSHQPGQEGLV